MEKVYRLLRWAKGGKAAPLTMELNLTNRCNLKCLSCWQRGVKIDFSNELPEERWIEIIEEAGELGVKELRIPGSGEPLTRRELIFQIVEKAKAMDLNCLLITNGTLFTPELIKRMVELEWDNVTFSIDGPNPKINDYLRGRRHAFEKATTAIKKFNYWKRKMRKDKPLLRINVVLSNKNFNRLSGMIRLAHRLGCEAVSIQPMTIFSKFGEKLKLSKEEIGELPRHLKEVEEVAKELGIHTNVGNFINSVEVVENTNQMDEIIKAETKQIKNKFLSLPCFEPWYNFVVMPNGTVGPCSVFGGMNGENIRAKSLAKIWYGSYFNSIRRRLLSKKLFPFCRNCCVVIFEENKKLRNELLRLMNG